MMELKLKEEQCLTKPSWSVFIQKFPLLCQIELRISQLLCKSDNYRRKVQLQKCFRSQLGHILQFVAYSMESIPHCPHSSTGNSASGDGRKETHWEQRLHQPSSIGWEGEWQQRQNRQGKTGSRYLSGYRKESSFSRSNFLHFFVNSSLTTTNTVGCSYSPAGHQTASARIQL